MFLLIAVASLCAVVLIATLVRLACAHRPTLWFTSDVAILCAVTPAMILLFTFGTVALGYRLTHGGVAAISVGGWIGAALEIGVSIMLWQMLARWIRRGANAKPSPA